jgi:hypothetical protein
MTTAAMAADTQTTISMHLDGPPRSAQTALATHAAIT